jgi:hypothetical protein
MAGLLKTVSRKSEEKKKKKKEKKEKKATDKSASKKERRTILRDMSKGEVFCTSRPVTFSIFPGCWPSQTFLLPTLPFIHQRDIQRSRTMDRLWV